MSATLWQAAAESDGGVNPTFFILGGLAVVVVVSTLGPLSRWHEHHEQQKLQARRTAEGPPTDETSAGPA